jgi:universal stress protein A
MLAIQTILHPTDFSERSDQAFRLACSLARDHGARVVLLHVAPPPATAIGGVMTPEPGGHEDCWEQLRRRQPDDPRVSVERLLAVDSPGEGILHAIRETHCDLVVMGTHGRTGLGRLLMGSVAEQVVRKAPCLVLTVKVPSPAGPPASEARK